MNDQSSNPDLKYWMGQVDSKLAHISDLLSAQTVYLDDLRGWRNNINERLAAGAQHFQSHDGRLAKIDDQIAAISGEFKEHYKDQEIHLVKGNGKYLTWPWLRDNLLVPVLKWGIIVVISYLLINEISLP